MTNLKQLISLGLLTTASISLSAQTTPLPYSNSFDEPGSLADWAPLFGGFVCEDHLEGYFWRQTVYSTPPSPPYVLQHGYDLDSEDGEIFSDWVISPKFNLENGGKLKFKINVNSADGTRGDTEKIGVFVAKSSGTDIVWVEMIENLSDLVTTTFEMTEIEVDVPPVDGNSTHIAFIYESYNNWWIVSIDDFELIEAPSGVKDVDLVVNKVELYPNPAQGNINIAVSDANLHFDQITIIDVQGKMIKQLPFTNSIDVSDLAPGNYHLFLRNAEVNVSKLFVVQ